MPEDSHLLISPVEVCDQGINILLQDGTELRPREFIQHAFWLFYEHTACYQMLIQGMKEG